jgi:hypothetical protein
MTQTTDMLKVQLGGAADSKSRTLLKTTRGWGNQHRSVATVAKTVAKPLNNTRRTWTALEYRPAYDR